MKEVTIENVCQRILGLEGAKELVGIGLHAEFELACLRQLVELEAKCAALAAENAAMHETIEAVRSVADNSSGIAGWHLNGDIATWEEILPEINDIETPTTDAFLAEVRAQGVEMFAASLKVVGGGEHPYSAVANEFAAQLRQEAAQ